MTSSRPYLLRAIYEWLNDNSLTSYLLVDAEKPDVMVPMEHVQDGKIILNITPGAVEGILLENDCVTFNARFSGKSQSIYIPMQAILALYSKENGKGMMFPEEEEAEVSSDDTSQTAKKSEPAQSKKKASFLKVVK